MPNENKLDRRRKYYFVLDCETATLPYAHEFTGEQRKRIAIAKPLIYDLGWKIIDEQGRVYRRKNYLISEIFSVPQIFSTAYYASKRPIYIDKLHKGEIDLVSWKIAAAEMGVFREDVRSDGHGAASAEHGAVVATPQQEAGMPFREVAAHDGKDIVFTGGAHGYSRVR
jgi:hypothetical protein